MPLKILTWSAALAAGPPTYTFSPAPSLLAVFFTSVTKPLRSLLAEVRADDGLDRPMVLGHGRRGNPPVHGGQRGEVPCVGLRLLQVGRRHPAVAHVHDQGGVEVLGLEQVLLVQLLGGFGRGRQVRRRIVLLRPLQLACQPAQGRDHQDPEHDDQVLGPAPAHERDQAAYTRSRRTPLGSGVPEPRSPCVPRVLTWRITGRPRGPACHVVLLTSGKTLIPCLGNTMYLIARCCQVISRTFRTFPGFPQFPMLPGSLSRLGPLILPLSRRPPCRAAPRIAVPHGGAAQSSVSCSGGAGERLRGAGTSGTGGDSWALGA